MKKTIMMTLIHMSIILLSAQTIIVRDVAGSAYRTIQAGINACPNGGTVKIYPGTYTGTNNVNLNWTGKQITITRYDDSGEVIIDCQNNGSYAFSLNTSSFQDVIQNLRIKNSMIGISITERSVFISNCIIEQNFHGIWISNSNSKLVSINNCTIQNNSNNFGGAGIYASGKLHIESSTFNNNSALTNTDGTEGGALKYTGELLQVNNCTFTNNTGSAGGAVLHLLSNPNTVANSYILIKNNTFKSNSLFMWYGIASGVILLTSQSTISKIEINNNVFSNNIISNYYDQEYHDVRFRSTTTNPQRITYYNNTHYNSPNNSSGISLNTGNHPVKIKNCLFQNRIISDNIQLNNTIGYCWFIQTNNSIPSTFTNNNITKIYYGDPKINTTTFGPLWTANVKSALIDMGASDTDGDGISWHTDTEDQDSDGTRKDIGAVQAQLHGAFTHTLSSQSATDRYNWICLPYLDKLYTNTSLYDADQLGYLLQDYHENQLLTDDPRVLDEFKWNYNQAGAIDWNGSSFQNTSQVADSRYGYKVRLVDGVATKQLEVSGFLCGTYGNTNETMTVNAPVNSPYREIWVGYFKPQSEDPLYALSDIANQLIEIKTKRWSMSRSSVNSTWSYSTRSPKFNFGEAVSLKYAGTTNKNFVWHVQTGGGTESMAYNEPAVSHFTYTEQMDYTPVYVQLTDEMINGAKANAELALFINDVCYGAEVIEGEVVEISAYINGLDLTNATIEFRYWDPSMKSDNRKIQHYAVYDEADQEYQNRSLDFSDQKGFYRVSLNQKVIQNSSVPKQSQLKGNYPNPFNPETHIRYQLSQSENVKLSIFNAKGQLIRTLVNERKEPGFYTANWNGTDESGKTVSSGIYVYQLKTAQHSDMKKMILMK